MKSYALIRISVLALALLAAGLTAARADSSTATDELKAAALGLAARFAPMNGHVLSSDGVEITADLGAKDGLGAGMRLSVMKTGAVLVHPITGERVGAPESEAGIAEAVSVTESSSRLRLVNGKADTGDVLRLTNSPVRALLYQKKTVDFDLAEELYYWLRDTDRFTFLELPPAEEDDAKVLERASSEEADIAIIIGAAGDADSLNMRALWVRSPLEFYSATAKFTVQQVEPLKIGDGIFTSEHGGPLLTIEPDFAVNFMASADLDGDGKAETALAGVDTIRVCMIESSLRPPFGLPEMIELKTRGKVIYLGASDLDEDGRDELVFTSLDKSQVRSAVYKYDGHALKEVYASDGFLRAAGGRLYSQEYDNFDGGYKGLVRAAPWPAIRDREQAALPPSADIYNFYPLGDGAVLVHEGYLELYATDGAVLWKSREHFGGQSRFYEKEGMTRNVEGHAKWGTSPRMMEYGGAVYTIKRNLSSTRATGLGAKTSGITMLTRSGGQFGVVEPIPAIKGEIDDFMVDGDYIYVLINRGSYNPARIFLGKRMEQSVINIYRRQGN